MTTITIGIFTYFTEEAQERYLTFAAVNSGGKPVAPRSEK
jgi:hypothetical protein